MIISETARQSGKGTDRYKSVIGLTKDEKDYIRKGGIVAFQSVYRSNGHGGTNWRIVRYSIRGRERFEPRVPDPEQIIDILKSLIAG